MLLIGQFSVLVHAQEHPFHSSHESCEAFVAAEQADSSLDIASKPLPVLKNDATDICFSFAEFNVLQSLYQARAPPFFS